MTYFLFPGCKRYQLTIISYKGKNSRGKKIWNCLCLCGNTVEVETNRFVSLTSPLKSCGRCEWHIHHNEAYVSWCAMKQRCNDVTRKDYKYYGGRGITYTPNWEQFVNFFIDMGDPPCDAITGERCSLDRIDVNGTYSKDNCKWSTRSEQQINKTNS